MIAVLDMSGGTIVMFLVTIGFVTFCLGFFYGQYERQKESERDRQRVVEVADRAAQRGDGAFAFELREAVTRQKERERARQLGKDEVPT